MPGINNFMWEIVASGAVLTPNGAVGGTTVPGDFNAQAVSQGVAGSYQVQYTGTPGVGDVTDVNLRLRVFPASGSQPGGKGAVLGIALVPSTIGFWGVAFWNQTADAPADVPFVYEIIRRVAVP